MKDDRSDEHDRPPDERPRPAPQRSAPAPAETPRPAFRDEFDDGPPTGTFRIPRS